LQKKNLRVGSFITCFSNLGRSEINAKFSLHCTIAAPMRATVGYEINTAFNIRKAGYCLRSHLLSCVKYSAIKHANIWFQCCRSCRGASTTVAAHDTTICVYRRKFLERTAHR
jgi:hypothetical protein